MVVCMVEPYESLRARLPQALVGVYDIHDLGNRPGTKPEHVFDTESGYRLIISIDGPFPKGAFGEDFPGAERMFHVSGSSRSFREKAEAKIREMQAQVDATDEPVAEVFSCAELVHGVDEEFEKISGKAGMLDGASILISDGWVVHFFSKL